MQKLKEKFKRWKASSDEEKFETLFKVLIVPPTLLFILFAWVHYTILPMVKLSYGISFDLNQDGIFTISDAWLLIKEMFYEPGASLTKNLSDVPLIQFFEIDTSDKYNIFSFIISFILFIPVILVGLLQWASSQRGAFLGFCEGLASALGLVYMLFVVVFLFDGL